jgi:predicted enzyme related to lactoylglutathione lyase
MSGMEYVMFTVDDRPVAGLMTIPEGAQKIGIPAAWLGYVHVDDVDMMAADLVLAGGVVKRPAVDIPGVGRFSLVSDPQGAIFALFHSTMAGDPPSEVAPGTPGHVGWHELYAADGPSAFDFYSKNFDWQLQRDFDMGPMGVYKIFGQAGKDVGGIMTKPDSMPVPAWTFYFTVPAIDAAIERVNASGGSVINGPMEVPGGSWVIQCLDPQGAMFALVAPEK